MSEDPLPPFWKDFRQHWQSAALGPILLRHLRAWWWNIPPDPWSEEVEAGIQDEEAMMICHHCLEPYAFAPDFCLKCGAAIGPYNNVKPFERIFSIGEVFRNGVGPHPNLSPLTRVGYFLFAMLSYSLFAPLYFFRLIRNARRLKAEPDQGVEDLDTGEDISGE